MSILPYHGTAPWILVWTALWLLGRGGLLLVAVRIRHPRRTLAA